jgi:polysaccharide pyruvyl transferase CsaB
MGQSTPLRIGISGSYGGMNLGDEAILGGVLSRLRDTVNAEVTVFSRNPADTLERHQVEKAVPVRSLTRREIVPIVRDLDLLVIGGGGILFDGEAEIYLREAQIAHELEIPVVVYAISAGPLVTEYSRRVVRETLNGSPTTLVSVRDRQGYRLLEDVGVTQEIHHTADPAFLLVPEEPSLNALRSEGVDLAQHQVGFSVREPGPAAPDIDPLEYYALLAHAADFMVDRYNVDVVFIPMEIGDVQHSHAVASRMKNAARAVVLRRRYSARKVLYLLSQFDFAVGMRLHFLIFAAIQRTPFVALPYAPKVTGLLEDLGMEMPPLERVSVGELLANIDRSWDTRADVKAKIDARVPELLARAASTNDLLLRALGKTTLGTAAAAKPASALG